MKVYKAIGFIWLGALLNGCIENQSFSEMGPNSHYIHKNSTVKTLGEVKSEYSSFSILIPPFYDLEDGYELYKDALVQKPGADLLTNYRIDHKLKVWPWLLPMYFMTVNLDGTAADMEIGGSSK